MTSLPQAFPASSQAGHPAEVASDSVSLAIEVQGLSHVYRSRAGQVEALADVSFRVPQGSLVAILGPSGCGKSTLLRILGGLVTPSSGTALLQGRPPDIARRQLGLGWLAQDDGLLPWRTVEENVSLALQLGGRGKGDPARVEAMLQRVGLADSLRRYPHELSGGMRQRAALARAMIGDPPFLFLDEPFANLDELMRERLGELVLDVRASTADEARPTTLLVTHSVSEAVLLADEVLAFSARPGRLIHSLPLALERPRHFDQPGLGAIVEQLRQSLRAEAHGDASFGRVG